MHVLQYTCSLSFDCKPRVVWAEGGETWGWGEGGRVTELKQRERRQGPKVRERCLLVEKSAMVIHEVTGREHHLETGAEQKTAFP